MRYGLRFRSFPTGRRGGRVGLRRHVKAVISSEARVRIPSPALRRCGPMDKAPAYGAGDSWFESMQWYAFAAGIPSESKYDRTPSRPGLADTNTARAQAGASLSLA